MNRFLRRYRLHIILFGCSLLLGAILAIILGQDINWDLLNYHYYAPYAFLHHRIGFDIAPGQYQSYGNPLLDIPSYLLISHLRPILAGAFLGAIQGINAWLVFEIALVLLAKFKMARRLRFEVATLLGVLSFFGAANLSEVGNTMGDNLLSILILLALWLLLLALRNTKQNVNSTKLRLAAYFIAGLAAGLKLTNASYVVALLLAGLLIDGSVRNRLKQLVYHGSSALAGILVSSGFWFVRMWQMFHNPIFPYYNKLFHSTHYLNINFVDERWFPKTLARKLLYPFVFAHTQNQTAEIPFRDPRLAVLYLLLLVTAIVWIAKRLLAGRKRLARGFPPEHAAFWIFLLTSYVLWEKQFSYYRYLIPIELLSLIAIALVLYSLLHPLIYTPTGVLVVILVGIIGFTTPINWGRIPWQPTYFGIQLPTQPALTTNSTVLISGFNPFGFLVPSLPPQDRVVRVESNMAFPTTNQPQAEITLIRQTLAHDRAQGKQFYALESSDEQAAQLVGIQAYGYTNDSCGIIKTYSNEYVFGGNMQFTLCRLRPS
jgi:hypothetical protein